MTCGGEAGMGPRIREDNGGEGAHKGRPYGDAGGRGWVPGWGRDPSASLRCTRNDVSGRVEGRAVREPHLRLVINVGFDGAKLVYFRSHEVLVEGRGWVPAFARTTEGRAPTRDAPTEMPGAGDGFRDGGEIPRLRFAALGMTFRVESRDGRFANRICGSLSTWALTAQSWSIFVVMKCWSGVGDGSPHSRGQRRGGRPRGTPLRRCRGEEEVRDWRRDSSRDSE